MQRNEYRRALIMLRSLLNGYSGHARIEIRTLTGSLNIRTMIPQGAQSVRAALVGKRSALYYAYPLGNLRRDMRGQAGLSVSFDPRDIGGRTLDAYSLLALVTVNDGVCELALVGNINGSTENDWSRVRDVVCALYAPEPRPEDLIQTPYGRSADDSAEVQPEEPLQADIVCEGDSCVLEFDNNDASEMKDNGASESYEVPQDDGADETNDGGLVWDLSQQESMESETPEIFRREGWNFTRIKLPSGCGYEYAYAGTPSCGGEMCVALPAKFSAEPPVGLEDYAWTGGTGTGYWVKCYRLEEN